MTIYDKGLIRAMKQAYKEDGYYVAVIEDGILIQSDSWGVLINADAVPSSIKSLIVLHNGSMPRFDSAVHIQKNECGDAMLEAVIGTVEDLAKAYTANGGSRIKPTRLIMDGCRVWQTTDKLKIKLVHVDSQQILAGQSVDAYLVAGNYVYGRNWFGCMFIRTEMVVHEDVPLLDHLAEMQWIPVEIADV